MSVLIYATMLHSLIQCLVYKEGGASIGIARIYKMFSFIPHTRCASWVGIIRRVRIWIVIGPIYFTNNKTAYQTP